MYPLSPVTGPVQSPVLGPWGFGRSKVWWYPRSYLGGTNQDRGIPRIHVPAKDRGTHQGRGTPQIRGTPLTGQDIVSVNKKYLLYVCRKSEIRTKGIYCYSSFTLPLHEAACILYSNTGVSLWSSESNTLTVQNLLFIFILYLTLLSY